MIQATSDNLPLRGKAQSPLDASKSPKLKAFLEAALNPHRQYQADKLGEDWIQELRGVK